MTFLNPSLTRDWLLLSIEIAESSSVNAEGSSYVYTISSSLYCLWFPLNVEGGSMKDEVGALLMLEGCSIKLFYSCL